MCKRHHSEEIPQLTIRNYDIVYYLLLVAGRHSFFFLFVAVSTILICYLSLVFINSSCCSLVLVESLYQLLIISN